jgi:hypothetical protein
VNGFSQQRIEKRADKRAMQGSARRDTSALASALALTARTFILCPCCENRGTLCRHTGEGRGRSARIDRPRIRFYGASSPASTGKFYPRYWRRWAVSKRVERAKVARMCRAAQPARAAGASVADLRSSPIAGAATAPFRSDAIESHRRPQTATFNHRSIHAGLGSDSSRKSASSIRSR